MSEQQLLVLAVTGGPGSGKTSSLPFLARELQDHGIKVVTVPEVARAIMAGGVTPTDVDSEHFQEAIINLVVEQEKIFRGLASRLKDKRVVVLCDRGAMDSKAYLNEATWKSLMAKNAWNEPMLRDARYDAVIHFVTAADGAPEFYRTDNERKETAAQAIQLDEATRDAWVGHSHLHIVDNSTNFEEKLRRALAIVLHHLGLPIPLEIERKYRVERAVLRRLPQHACPIDIEQFYLRYPDGTKERIRRRSQDGFGVYYLTRKRDLRPGVCEEIERFISPDLYRELSTSEHAVSVMRKRRWCFCYKNQYFELDDLKESSYDFCLLEIELTDEQNVPSLPTWLGKHKDVTGMKRYGNAKLARPVVR